MRAGGSAAAAALFAGIAAIIDEKNGPQGNLAPQLYELSRTEGIFADVQQGDARLLCAEGSANCDASGKIGFDAVAGYDLATGLGSVDAQKLVNEWARAAATGTDCGQRIAFGDADGSEYYVQPHRADHADGQCYFLNGRGIADGNSFFRGRGDRHESESVGIDAGLERSGELHVHERNEDRRQQHYRDLQRRRDVRLGDFAAAGGEYPAERYLAYHGAVHAETDGGSAVFSDGQHRGGIAAGKERSRRQGR